MHARAALSFSSYHAVNVASKTGRHFAAAPLSYNWKSDNVVLKVEDTSQRVIEMEMRPGARTVLPKLHKLIAGGFVPGGFSASSNGTGILWEGTSNDLYNTAVSLKITAH